MRRTFIFFLNNEPDCEDQSVSGTIHETETSGSTTTRGCRLASQSLCTDDRTQAPARRFKKKVKQFPEIILLTTIGEPGEIP